MLGIDIIENGQEIHLTFEDVWERCWKRIENAINEYADILRRLKPSGFLGHPATLSGVAPFGQARCPLPASLSTDN